ncbi:MAG: exonuclease domain-containing protein [Tannerellaceae bacterium]
MGLLDFLRPKVSDANLEAFTQQIDALKLELKAKQERIDSLQAIINSKHTSEIKVADTTATFDFVAFDFETATPMPTPFPCQIGVAAMKDGKIVASESFLIQPPNNVFDRNMLKYHHVRPADTQNALPFNKVWPLIEKYLSNTTLIAHNATFDYNVLCFAADYYDVDISKVNIPICTMSIHDGRGLYDCSIAYNVPLENHHDAKCDAEACAMIYEKVRSEGVREVEKQEKPTKESFFSFEKVSKENCAKQEGVAENVITDKCVVITGIFDLDRQQITDMVYALGGRTTSSISKKTDYVLAGDGAGPKKFEKIEQMQSEGHHIQVIDWDFFQNIADKHLQN